MFCMHCGKHIADNVKFCPHCGGATGYVGPVVAEVVVNEPVQEKGSVRSGLGLAITFTVLSVVVFNVLGIITGIIGIVFAGMANSKNASGDIAGAKSRARVSKAMNITTIVLFILWIIMFVALIIFAVNATMEATEIIQQSDVVHMSASQMQEFLSEHGYDYSIEVLEDYIEHGLDAAADWQ